MTVRDTWLTADGRHTRDYGCPRRWAATWAGADGKRHSKAFTDRAEAAQHVADMQAAVKAARSTSFSLLALIREALTKHDRWDAAALAAELQRTIPHGHEEAALMAALEAVATTAVALQGGPAQSPPRLPGSRPGAGRPRTSAQAAKDAQAATMRAQGKPYKEIAAALGVSTRGGAHAAVRRGLADQAQRTATSGGAPAAVA